MSGQIEKIMANTKLPEGVRINLRGSVQNMNSSFKSFGIGLLLAVILVYLVLVAQFASFLDPLIILLAVPPGLAGVLLFLLVTGTTLNVMSLMGVVMMVGIVDSNSILIVEFTRQLRAQGEFRKERRGGSIAAASATGADDLTCNSAWPDSMALKLGTGSEAYAPLARAIIGGLLVSVVVTVYLVPAAYLWFHRRDETGLVEAQA